MSAPEPPPSAEPPPFALPVPSSQLHYASPNARNPAATWALICGILLFIPYLTGILAITLGRAGARHARENGAPGAHRARAGIILGIISVALSILMTIAAVPAYFQAREAARTTQCMSNLRTTAVGLLMYANANRGWLPPALPPTLPPCPELLHTNPAATSNYIYLRPALPIQRIRGIANQPVVIEPLSNHRNKLICVLYLDGHVAVHHGSAAQAILALATTQPATRPDDDSTR